MSILTGFAACIAAPVCTRSRHFSICGCLFALVVMSVEAQQASVPVVRSDGSVSWTEKGSDSFKVPDLPPQTEADFNVLLLRRAHEVVTLDQPRLSLLAAGMVAVHDGPQVTGLDAWLHFATTAGAKDSAIWWMLLDLCDSLHDLCDPYRQTAWQRLSELEPDNAAVWLRRVPRQARDSHLANEYFRHAASATHWDNHDRDWAKVLREFYSGIEIPPDYSGAYLAGVGKEIARYSMIQNAISSVDRLGMQPPSQCMETPERPLSASTRADCQKVCALMSSSDMRLTRQTGLTLCLKLSASASEERTLWAKQLLQLFWLSSRGELYEGTDTDEKIVAVFDDRVRNGEYASQQHILERAGVPPNPPAGWNPPNFVSDELRQLLHEGGAL